MTVARETGSMSAARPWNIGRLFGLCTICVIAWIFFAFMSMLIGSGGNFGIPGDSFIVSARWERVGLASLVGVALGAAGVAYQAVLRNDLAEPYLLGVASGATLGSYLWKIPAVAGAMVSLGPIFAGVSQQSFAFVGGLLAAATVLGVASARGRSEPAVLVLTGVVLSTIIASILLLLHSLLRTMPGSGYFQSVFIGELQTNLTRTQIISACVVIAFTFLFLAVQSGRLNVTRLNDDEAMSMGVRIVRTRRIVMAVASLMTAAAVAVSGPIGFVGLIAPHVGRRIVGGDVRKLLPAATTLGAILLVAADACARLLAGLGVVNSVLPVGIFTAAIGGPFLLVLLARRK